MRVLVCLALLFAFAQSQTEETPLTWTAYKLDGNAYRPEPRRQAMAGYDEARQQIIVFGGRSVNEDGDTDTIFVDTWVFDIRNMTWRLLETVDSPPPTFAGNAGVIQGEEDGYFVIATGDLGDDERTSNVWVLSLEAAARGARDSLVTWHRLPTYGDVPKPRYGAAGTIHANTFFLSHGFNYVRFADTFKLDLTPLVEEGPDTPCKWEQIGGGSTEYSPTHPHPRCLAASTVTHDDKLVMFGGCLTGGEYGGPCPSRDGWVYNTAEDEWTWTSDGPGQSVMGVMVPIEEDEVLLWGGDHWSDQLISSNDPDPAEVHVLNPSTGVWTRYRAVAFKDDDTHIPEIRVGPVFVSMAHDHHHDDTPTHTHYKQGVQVFLWGGDGGDDETSDWIYMLQGNLTATEDVGLGWFWWTYWHLHGLFMFIAWGVLFQLSICVARYGKGNSAWFTAHRACNVFALLISIVGIIFGFVSAGAVIYNVNFAHSVAGIIILILSILQPINGLLRTTKESSLRGCWELVHKGLGWFLTFLAFANIFLGLIMALLNRIAWAFLAYIVLLLILHLLFTLMGWNKNGDGSGAGDYAPMGDGVFKSSEVFKAGTKGGSSALYQ